MNNKADHQIHNLRPHDLLQLNDEAFQVAVEALFDNENDDYGVDRDDTHIAILMMYWGLQKEKPIRLIFCSRILKLKDASPLFIVLSNYISKSLAAFGLVQEGVDDFTVKYLSKQTKISIEEAMEGLSKLIGLASVKRELNQLIAIQNVNAHRMNQGFDSLSQLSHIVFTGNPGTGKTTVARLVGQIFSSLGILESGHVVEVDRSGIVGQYIGHTEKNMQEIIQRAMGGVLFIDEAYSLSKEDSSRDFGNLAIEVLLKAMEDFRGKFIVIAAGYSENMSIFMNSNPGLASRFSTRLHFDDYDNNELLEIFTALSRDKNISITEVFGEYFKNLMQEIKDRSQVNFGNARIARNAFEICCKKMALRAVEDGVIEDHEIEYFVVEDLPAPEELV